MESSQKPLAYEESSQFRHWRFSPAGLYEIRQSSNEAAIKRVRRNLEEEKVRHFLPTSTEQADHFINTHFVDGNLWYAISGRQGTGLLNGG